MVWEAVKRQGRTLHAWLLHRFDPELAGLVEGAAVSFVLMVFVGAMVAVGGVTLSSADAFLAVAQIGATLLVAYAVEVALLLKSPGPGAASSGQRGLIAGLVAGAGVAGLVAVALSVACAERVETGEALSAIWTGAAGTALVGLLWLGFIVAILPLAWYWKTASPRPESDDD